MKIGDGHDRAEARPCVWMGWKMVSPFQHFNLPPLQGPSVIAAAPPSLQFSFPTGAGRCKSSTPPLICESRVSICTLERVFLCFSIFVLQLQPRDWNSMATAPRSTSPTSSTRILAYPPFFSSFLDPFCKTTDFFLQDVEDISSCCRACKQQRLRRACYD